MIVYIKNPKESTKNLELISYYSKVARYKVSIWKLIVFLYTNNVKVEFGIENTMSFALVLSKIEYLGIKLKNM